MLCLSGLDPTGGAGLQADIEAIAALGGHALGLVTALTVQDSRNVAAVHAVDPSVLAAQLDCLLADCRPAIAKLGLIGDPAQLPVILAAVRSCGAPLVCDPVLRAGGGAELLGEGAVAALRHELLPAVSLLTPNAAEARRLCPGAGSLDDCGADLLAAGCGNVLITGGDEPGPEVVNTWYAPGRPPRRYAWPRLPETFHGAGCTLAAAIAALWAQGLELEQALEQGQRWTHQALQRAFAVGRGRRIPGRFGSSL
ncbi:MAG TPA: hydroxymethylpyrimidine/phosphomethylpyrimidine kinase [Nevskia sp.]|nr:hydroxymethylpyrimidine/phosphomethylpyrimidine kinase [Nevskia sp.]